MGKILKRKTTIFFLVFGIIIILIGGSFLHMRSFEKKSDPIELGNQTDKTIVFYRDDCPDCQSVFPLLYYHNLLKNDLIFVNMNQPLNRHYIQKYNLKSVPTIVTKSHEYTGSNKEKLRQFLNSRF